MVTHYRFAFRFYGYSALTAWACWAPAAYLSHRADAADYSAYVSFFGLLGLCGPLLVALYYSAKDKKVMRDVVSRLTNFQKSTLPYLLLSVLLMPLSILLSMLLSLLIGHSSDQFIISGQASFSSGVLPVWFILIMAPVIEELAWHSYGTDCLRRRYSLFTTSMLFAVYWAIWHLPLAFVNGYYHSNLVVDGVIYSINFLLSLFPFVLLMNWLYYKANRNILVAVLLHLTANVFNEIFATHPDSKVIQTVFLLALTVFLLISQKSYFFSKDVADEPTNSQSTAGVAGLSLLKS
ncbi:MAG: CPBP family intramembrane metalloprotease [Gammaproteobacteria bacterium]|nr:CPBP family intramembrane metalloprotease [Gammaproteobacteria bacterium]MDH5803419.1 CPBP family intramembrane metalloprotease [Gammaproteobacteria bacterium]